MPFSASIFFSNDIKKTVTNRTSPSLETTPEWKMSANGIFFQFVKDSASHVTRNGQFLLDSLQLPPNFATQTKPTITNLFIFHIAMMKLYKREWHVQSFSYMFWKMLLVTFVTFRAYILETFLRAMPSNTHSSTYFCVSKEFQSRWSHGYRFDPDCHCWFLSKEEDILNILSIRRK